MKYYFSIKLKLILYILGITLGAVLISGIIGYKVTEKQLREEYKEKFTLINALKVNKIQNYFELIESSISLVENNKYIRSNLPYFSGMLYQDEVFLEKKEHVASIILRQLEYIKEIKNIKDIALINDKGEQLFTTGHIDYSNEVIKKFSTDINTSITKIEYSNNYLVSENIKGFDSRMLAKASFKLKGQQPIIIICEIDLNPLIREIRDTTSLKNTGETILLRKEQNQVIYLNPVRHDKNILLRDTLKITKANYDKPEILATEGKTGFGNKKDYRNEEVLAYWSYIPKMNWGIITKMDKDEAYESVNYLKGVSIILGVFILIFTTLIITVFADNFIRPILNIKNNLIDLYNGAFPQNLSYKSNNEIKQTTDAINALVGRLKVSTEFASKIGKGDLNAELDTTEYGDVLNKSLISMRDNILLSQENEEKRNWAMLGQAYLSDPLRASTKNFNKWCSTLLSEICRYTDASVGVFYVKDVTELLQPSATFAFDSTKLKPLASGQSLVGQAYKQKKVKILAQQPEHYLEASSIVGNISPEFILIIPMMHSGKCEGVMELGYRTRLDDYKINFLEEFAKSIGATLSVINQN